MNTVVTEWRCFNFAANNKDFILLTPKCPEPTFEIWAGNYSFDVEVLKFLLLGGHFIRYMGI